jgi:hypothetical protein
MKFYDEGWNDYIKGEPLPTLKEECTRDYRDGWLDARHCEKYSPDQLTPIN